MPSMVMLVLHGLTYFNPVMAAWREAGAPAITIFDSVGSRELEEQVTRDDLPLMPSVRDLLQSDDAPRKSIFAIVEDAVVDPLIEATEKVMGDLAEAQKGILFVVPVTRVVGYRT